MVLKLFYEKNGHTYVKKCRSYVEMDAAIEDLKKKGYNIVGGDFYNS
jgi:hypothetical protein